MLTEAEVRAWIESAFHIESAALESVRVRTAELDLPHEEIFLSQVALLKTLVVVASVRDVLELGTFLGYGATALLEALDDVGGGRLTTVDCEVRFSKEAERLLAARNLVSEVEFVRDDAWRACSMLREAGLHFDLILLDVAEVAYPVLYEPCVNLLRRGGLLVIDNVLMQTEVGWVTRDNVLEGGRTEPLDALRHLIDLVREDPRVAASVIPVGSGLLLCGKR